ncbi:MAG: hypothetical protein ACI9ES_003261, partial [Oceanospirillaceae bacterium]
MNFIRVIIVNTLHADPHRAFTLDVRACDTSAYKRLPRS